MMNDEDNSTCPYLSWVGAYHDGELPEPRTAELEAHLVGGCTVCAAELDALRRVSLFLGTEPAAMLPARAKARLHEHVDSLHADALAERSLLRLAEVLSGVAAAVLVAASAWMLRTSSVSAEPLPPWERAAMMLQPASPLAPEPIHAARWIMIGLAPEAANDRNAPGAVGAPARE